MSTHAVATLILLCGSVLLVVGPLLQAKAESQRFDDILDASGLRTPVALPLPKLARLLIVLIAPTLPFAFDWAMRILRSVLWAQQQRDAVKAKDTGVERDAALDTLSRLNTAVVVGRNWLIVVAGGVVIAVGAAIEFGLAVVEGH